MFEGFRSFADYVQEYDIERAEGLLVRHLNSVYKVLVQTVPDQTKSEAVLEVEFYLRDMLRRVDSSLLEEWQRMLDPARAAFGETGAGAGAGGSTGQAAGAEEPPDITRDVRTFTASIRTRVFAFLRAWSIERDEAALETIDAPEDADGRPWTPERLRAVRDAYRAEHGVVRLDPEARNLRHTHVAPSDDGARFIVQQTLVDPDGFNDWILEIDVDLAASRAAGEPVLRLRRIGSLVGST
jgi:hypothetical protein